MNLAEAGRRMSLSAVVLFFASLITALAALMVGPGFPGVNTYLLLFLIVFPAVVLLLAGWIVQGFAVEGTRKDN